MAESISASLTAPANVIAGAPAIFLVTVTNSGDANATVNSVAPLVNPLGFPFRCQPFQAPAGRSMVVSASGGTLVIPMTAIFYESSQGANGTLQPSARCDVSFSVTSAAGSSASTAIKTIPISPNTSSQPPTSGGQLDFSVASNSAFAL